jgi:hypothetical protein
MPFLAFIKSVCTELVEACPELNRRGQRYAYAGLQPGIVTGISLNNSTLFASSMVRTAHPTVY